MHLFVCINVFVLATQTNEVPALARLHPCNTAWYIGSMHLCVSILWALLDGSGSMLVRQNSHFESTNALMHCTIKDANAIAVPNDESEDWPD